MNSSAGRRGPVEHEAPGVDLRQRCHIPRVDLGDVIQALVFAISGPAARIQFLAKRTVLPGQAIWLTCDLWQHISLRCLHGFVLFSRRKEYAQILLTSARNASHGTACMISYQSSAAPWPGLPAFDRVAPEGSRPASAGLRVVDPCRRVVAFGGRRRASAVGVQMTGLDRLAGETWAVRGATPRRRCVRGWAGTRRNR